jgi:hypothetical protein
VPSLHIIKELSARLGIDADWLATGSSSGDAQATEEVRDALAARKRAADDGDDRQEALERLIRSVERALWSLPVPKKPCTLRTWSSCRRHDAQNPWKTSIFT